MRKTIYALLTIFTLTLSIPSCSEKEEEAPTPQSQLIDEWELVRTEFVYYDEDGNVSGTPFIREKGTDNWNESWETYLAFYEGGTYEHYESKAKENRYGSVIFSDLLPPTGGTWEYKNNNTVIVLTSYREDLEFQILESSATDLRLFKEHTEIGVIKEEMTWEFKK
ncbi:hypothetical protein WJR50_20555 [Catalinimonas sp. 4WD22]|uniref:hypothetical protein n=1 Tax=Catalinimonas locisalis TaxID=3133978 RepID=UPI0031015EB5